MRTKMRITTIRPTARQQPATDVVEKHSGPDEEYIFPKVIPLISCSVV